MASPFPGMNPYLEQDYVWHDFHERFIPLCSEMLVPQVRPGYIVRLDEHVYIHELPADERRRAGRVDVGVARLGAEPLAAASTAVFSAPARGKIVPEIDVVRHSFVEIRDRRNRELVTVIELLSPANKRLGPDREQYLSKRYQLLSSPAHLVEIDLLRGDPRLPLEGLPACAYYVMVSRAEERPHVGLWPMGLHDCLPTIPIPLRAPDPDARLVLEQLIHRLYDAAGYDDYIYTGQPQPPLSDADRAWARDVLKDHRFA
jgi:Protein of unknown function (DUF4058)